MRVVAALEAGIAFIGARDSARAALHPAGLPALAGHGSPASLAARGRVRVVLTAADDADGRDAAGDRALDRRDADGASDVGLLYMANIAGGAAGTVLAGFYLLRVHDTVVATAVAVAINLVGAALAFWWLATRAAARDATSTRA